MQAAGGEVTDVLRTPRITLLFSLALVAALSAAAQQPQIGGGLKEYVKVNAAAVAITHVRVIDGTGAPALENQTVVIRDGKIAAIGPNVAVPEGTTVIDGTGKSVMPGIVMLHEHLYYPVGQGVYGQFGQSFTRLYLAGGVTSDRKSTRLNSSH